MDFGRSNKVFNFKRKSMDSKALVSDEEIAWEEIEPGLKRKVMTYNEQLMLVKVAFEKDVIGTLHNHPHLQISYVASGQFKVTVGDESKILKSGDVFFVQENEVHGVVCLEAGELIDVFNPHREDFV